MLNKKKQMKTVLKIEQQNNKNSKRVKSSNSYFLSRKWFQNRENCLKLEKL